MTTFAKVQRLQGLDYALSKVQDNLGNAVDSMGQALNSGALSLLCGSTYAGATTAGTINAFSIGSLNSSAYPYVMPAAGTIVSVQGLGSANTSTTFTLYLYKNGTIVWTNTPGSLANGATPFNLSVSSPNTFVAGDQLYLALSTGSSTTTTNIHATIAVEMSF